MRKKQFTEGERLERALKRWIAIRELPMRSPEWHAAIRELVMLKKSLTEPDLERRRARRVEMGMPPLNSPEWKAELERLRPLEARGRTLHEPPENVDRLTRDLMTIAARQANGEAVALFKTPGQHYAHNLEQRAAAKRLYRWLWRHFPGQLRACKPELRKLIRDAGGVA